jgi:glutaredoxin-like protein NrdH
LSIATELPRTTTGPAAAEASAVPTVTVFSKNDCSICDAVEAKFTERGIPFREINVQTDTAPRAEFGNKTPFDFVVERYGRSMPVVVVEDGPRSDSWTGRRPDKVLALIQHFEAIDATIPVEVREAHTSHL